MIAQLACCLAISMGRQVPQDGKLGMQMTLKVPPGSPALLYIQAMQDPMDPPKLSPKRFGENQKPWEFPWVDKAYAHLFAAPSPNDLRILVYSQEQKGNQGMSVARMLLRIWSMNYRRMRLTQSPVYHDGLVEVYLCFGGRAGGEQLFGQDLVPDPKQPDKTDVEKVNTIYIYDMPSFTDPVEMAREVAHEYGHATWPPVGGFKDPEEWADGYLAEKVFLRWLRDGIASGELSPDDAMGATKAGLDAWLAAHADPLILKAAQTQPTPNLTEDPSAAGMDAFIGMALYLDTLYTDRVLVRSLNLCGYKAKEYPDAAVLAAEEPDQITLNIPKQFIRKLIWIPLGAGKLTGASILRKAPNGWVQIMVGANPVVVTNARP